MTGLSVQDLDAWVEKLRAELGAAMTKHSAEGGTAASMAARLSGSSANSLASMVPLPGAALICACTCALFINNIACDKVRTTSTLGSDGSKPNASLIRSRVLLGGGGKRMAAVGFFAGGVMLGSSMAVARAS